MPVRKITATEAVLALRRLGTASSASTIASSMSGLGHGEVTSRAVATALRVAVADGRVTCTYRRTTNKASYRFVRLAMRTFQGAAP
jgi:hypothetical protein